MASFFRRERERERDVAGAVATDLKMKMKMEMEPAVPIAVATSIPVAAAPADILNSSITTASPTLLSKPRSLEEEMQALRVQMDRVVAFCDAQKAEHDTSRLEHEIQELRAELRHAQAEKDYWMQRCKEAPLDEASNISPICLKARGPQCVKKHPRRLTNSELIVIADRLGAVNEEAAHQDDSSSSPESEGSDAVGTARSSFRLLQCSDEQCEVFTPMRRSIRTQHRARNNVQFMWDEKPTTVLIVKKPRDPTVTKALVDIAHWMQERKITVYLEPRVHEEVAISRTLTWSSEEDWEECQHCIDFVISLGGDGTVLWVSSMFRKNVPPVISFAMGSLGFLTPFDVENYPSHLQNVVDGGFYLSMRSRITGTICRKDRSRGPALSLHAVNEIVIDRGPHAALVELDCYCDGLHITRIAADGIIIGTPTGSTAYSLSSGGSITHPSVPSMLFTPICPHTLSFRPLLLHDSATLKIVFPVCSRASSAYVSFDGKNRVQLERGDSITVRVSSYPLPSICRSNENKDWFESVITNLNWNQRIAQKPWAMTETDSTAQACWRERLMPGAVALPMQ